MPNVGVVIVVFCAGLSSSGLTVAVKNENVVPTTAVNNVATAITLKKTIFFFSIFILLQVIYFQNY